jgi:streptogramin lyase
VLGMYGVGQCALDVAVDSNGSLYIAVPSSMQVDQVKVSALGQVLAVFNQTTPSLLYPSGVRVDTVGNVYIIDNHVHAIFKLDPNGLQLAMFNATVPPLIHAIHMHLDREDNMWIANHDANCVITLNPAGKQLAAFTVSTPYGVTLDAAGDLYVTDELNHQVVKLSGDDGKVLAAYRVPAPGLALGLPYGVGVTSQGDVVVSDFNNGRLVIFRVNDSHVEQAMAIE